MSTVCQSRVDRRLTEMSIECRSPVLIDTRSRVSIVHMIQTDFKCHKVLKMPLQFVVDLACYSWHYLCAKFQHVVCPTDPPYRMSNVLFFIYLFIYWCYLCKVQKFHVQKIDIVCTNSTLLVQNWFCFYTVTRHCSLNVTILFVQSGRFLYKKLILFVQT